MMDFNTLPKIDAHIHYNNSRSTLCKLGEAYGFQYLTINTEVPFFPSVKEQSEIATGISSHYTDRVEYVGTFQVSEWGKKTWHEQALSEIRETLDAGARGIKIWKNIGMELRDPSGAMVMINDSRFDPVIDYLESNSIPVIGHLGEPRNCWLPIDEMTVKSDREYFKAHPEYHMHLHPELPSYEDQIGARDAMLDKHPGLRFIGAHLASLEWSVDKVAKWLNRYPNTAVDLAERINHLQLQSVSNHSKVASFFESYQDRIIYGTDIIDDGQSGEQELSDELTGRWLDHWKFFSSDEILQSHEFPGLFRGLNLSGHIIEKIYWKNAKNWYMI
ncbi:MAG: amidohydrolase family protein [Balneolales bacterium]